jgi:MYND finger
MSDNRCSYELCDDCRDGVSGVLLEAKFRCSRCKSAYYCSANHQKLHWSRHKISCRSVSDIIPTPVQSSEARALAPRPMTAEDVRQCRCMFCGCEMVLSSEEEAVSHMKVCPALQEQLANSDQFTIPKTIQAKLQPRDSSNSDL